MDKITGEDFRSFIVVLAALVVFVGGILSLIKNWRELKKPHQDGMQDLESWRRATDLKLDNDNKRLADIEKCNKVMVQSQLAILNHMITGNGDAKLKEARDAVSNYLINR